jgi:plastocyanin
MAAGQNYRSSQPKPNKPVPSQGIIKVHVVDYAFHPGMIRVNAGKPVQVQLRNGGTHPHNIVFDLPGVDPRISRNVAPGRSGTVTFRAPNRKGSYRFYCPIGDHAKRGMVGTLVVK